MWHPATLNIEHCALTIEHCTIMPPHADRAAGTLRSPGERLRRHRLQRTRPHARSRALRRWSGSGRQVSRAVCRRSSRRRSTRSPRTPASLPHSRVPRLPGIHMEGPYSRRRTARAARIPARDVDAGQPRRLQAVARTPPAAASCSSRSRRKCPARCRSSSISSPPACASPSVTRPPTPQQIRDAIAAGATLATHLGNGCRADRCRAIRT